MSPDLADPHPEGGYWTTVGQALESIVSVEQLTEDVAVGASWESMLTWLRMNGQKVMADEMQQLLEDTVVEAAGLSRDMDAVAYLTDGGPVDDPFYRLYRQQDDLVTYQAAVQETQAAVAADGLRLAAMLETVAGTATREQTPSERERSKGHEKARKVGEGMRWQVAMRKAEEIVKRNGGKMLPISKLQKLVGCKSRGPIRKAIENSLYLKARKAEQEHASKAREVPLTDVHLDETEQSREPEPLNRLIEEERRKNDREERQHRRAARRR